MFIYFQLYSQNNLNQIDSGLFIPFCPKVLLLDYLAENVDDICTFASPLPRVICLWRFRNILSWDR